MIKRFFWLLLMMAAVVGCQDIEPTPQPTPRGLGGGTTGSEEVPSDPTLDLSESSGTAGAAVLLSGRDFPEGTFVEIRLSEVDGGRDEQLLVTVQTDEIGTFATPLTMPTLWPETLAAGQANLQITVETLTEPALIATANYQLSYEGAFRTYTNDVGGFAVDIPAAWTVGEGQSTPLGTMFLLGNEPLVPGDPAVSTILISEELTAARAAEQLLCGGGCVEEVRLQVVEDGEMGAIYKKEIVSEGSPTLTWYFVERDGRLIYLTLHDPVTYRSLDDLVETLRFEVAADVVAAVPTEEAPTATATAEAIEEATPTSTATETIMVTDVQTVTATVAETATTAATPTSTPTPTATSTPTITPSATATPSNTPPPTATVNPFSDLGEAGPVETATAFMLALIRNQIVSMGDASAVLAEELVEEQTAQEPLLAYMGLDTVFTAFNLSRLQSTDVIVRAELTFADGDQAERFLAFEQGEDGVWRITEITGEEDEAEEEIEGTETPESGDAGESEEETPTPESTPEDDD